MANSDKNIRIITNKNKSSLPNITFTGYNNDPVVLNVLDDNTISFEGSSGQLFSISNSVTSGTIFSVNDISGIPSFRVDADGTVGIAEFSGNVGIGLQSPQSKLSVGGDINASIGYSYRINGTMVLNASSLGTGVTLSALTSVGTVSSGTWSASPVSLLYGGTGASTAAQALANLGAASAGTNTDITRLTNLQSLQVTIPAAASIGMTIKAAASQTGNYLQFTTSADALQSWITKDGTFAHGAYFTHNDGRIPGISVQRSNAAGIVARGFNSDAFPAIEVQNNGGGLGVGLYPGGLVYGGVLQAYSTTGSTSTTTGALIVAGGAGIAGSLNTSTSFSSSISGLRILNASLSSATGTIAATNKIQVTVSDTDAFLVKNGGGTNIFDIDTSNNVISVFPSTGSTNSSTGALVVTGGVGIGGTLNARSVYVDNDLMHTPGVGNTFTNSWTSITFPSGFSASRIIYAENKFVAIGGSVVVYSSDLTNWTTSYIPWTGALSCQAIAYGNGYFAVMPSQSAYVAYSSDLSNWGIGSVTYQNYGSITYGNGRFIANSGAVVGISTNGTNWGSFTPSGNIGGGTISYHNGYFYTPSARSVDGINWESLNIPITIPQMQYGNGLYFGAQYNSANYTYSTDGLNFTSATIENNVYVGAEYHNGVYYLRTQHNNAYIYYSFDGKNYQKVGTPSGINVYSMAFGKNKIVIVGGTGAGSPYAYYAEGTNGKIDLNPIREGNIDNTVIGKRVPRPASFTDLSATGYANIVNQANSTSATSGALVVTGGVGIGQSVNIGGKLDVSNTINYVATNSGIANTWTRIAIPSPVSISGLTYGNGLYVGVGYSAATSTDGITWTARSLPHNLTTVRYGNNLYVGVNYGSALGATSTDGITWRSMSLPSSANWDGIAYGNGIYVITATYNNNLVAYSYNGFQWTLGSLPIPGGLGFFVTTPVIFGGGYFYTGSYSGVYYFTSVDGINWTLRTGLNAVATNTSCYGDGTWLLTGSSASLAYTKDLTNWTYGGHYGWSGSANLGAYTNGTFAIVDFGSLQCTLIYKNLSTVVLSNLPGPSYATTITAGEGKFIAGAGSTVYVTDVASHTYNIFPHNSGEINNVRIGAKFPSAAQFTVLNATSLVSFGATTPSISTSTGALVVKGGVGIGGSLFVGNTLSIASSTASTSSLSGALIVSGGVGIGQSLFTSPSYSSSISGVILNNGSATLSGTYTQNNSSTTAFSVKNAGGTSILNVDTTNSIVSVLASTASTNTSTGALVVTGGMGISGNINSLGRFNFGTLSAPTMSTLSGFGTGGLTPSTTYYYKLSAIDFNNNESLPSIEYSVALSGSQYGTRFYIMGVNGAVGYKLYRTTTSGSYTNSFVQTYRYNQFINSIFSYDIGKTTSTGTPLTTPTGNTATLGSDSTVPSNTLPSLTIPNGTLQVKSPNFTSYAPTTRGVSIETGAYDFIQIREPYGYNNSVSVSTGGTLTAGQTYYYVFTCLDHYGNESLPSQEIAFTADSGGAVIFNFSVATVTQAARRYYRTTTPGNYTNSYIGELNNHKDINYPTKNITPPTATQFAGAKILPVPDFGQYSFIPNIDVAPSGRNGAIRKIGTPYSGTLTLTTSGTAGSLLTNTIYYYKFVEVDIFGGSTYPSQEYFVGTGTSTAVTINTNAALWIEAKNYTKIYRSTTSNNFSNVPTYIVSSFPFTDVGDTTFAETPPSSSTNITAQLFQNANNQVPTNYLISLAIGPSSNSSPFAILAPQNGLQSVSASTGGTLTLGQVYYYVMSPVDILGFEGVSLQPIRFVATAGGAANITPGTIFGSYGYVYYNLYRSTTLASWSNTLIASAVRGNFIDINYPTRSGAPTFGHHRARAIVYNNSSNLFIPTLVNQTYGQHLTPPSIYRTGGNSSGSLTTNTTYYYRVVPFGGHSQAWGYASDEFSYTTGSNERNITLSIGGHKTGAMGYRVYRSTSFNNFTNAYYFETQHSDFQDLGFSTLQATPDLGVLAAPQATTVNRLDQLNGNVFVNTVITGQNGALKIHMKSPSALSLSSGTGGTLATSTDYFYRVEAVDPYGARSFPSEEAWINTASNNAVTITWAEVPGAYYYRIFRTTTSQSYTNTLIAGYVVAKTFTDINYPVTSGTPWSFANYPGTAAAALFQMDNAKNFGVMPRTIISNIDNSQVAWNTDFSLRITSPPVGSASGALLQVGAGFTNFSSAGFNGTTYGTQIAIGAAIGFSGSLLDAQTAGVSRFRINFDGSSNIGSTTGSGSTTTGALVISGGVGIGGSLFVGNTLNIGNALIVGSSTASTSSLSGALIVSGGVGISGNVNANGIIRSGQLSAPVFTISALGGTGALTPSTIYYYKLSALDYFGNESLPSNEVSISLNSSTYAVYLNPSVDYSVHKYKVFRTTTSGIYTTSLVDTFMNFKGYYNQSYLGSVYVDRGKPVSAGSPLTTATANKVYLGSTDKSSLGSLNLSGQLFIQNPNASVPDSRVGIQLGQFDISAVKDGTIQNLQSFTSATGGTLTAGTNYYYKFTTIDFYGNESLPSKEYAYTADSNGAVQLNLSGADQSVIKHRWYRTTTPGNYTNSYIGELPGYIDINYPTSNVSPPTTSTAYSYYLNSSTNDGTSYIRRLDTASGVRQLANNAYISISGITTSGIAGTLAPNTTYYYKIAGFDRLGNLSSSSSPYPINTGPATSVQITSNGVTWINGEDGFVVWRSTSKDNFSNAPAFYVQPGYAYTDTGNYEFIGTPPTSSNFVIGDFGGYNYAFAPFYFRQIDLGASLNNTSLRVLSAPARLPEIALVSGGTLTPGAVYYYKVMGFTNGGAHGMASASVRVVVGAGGAVRLTFYVGITSAYRYYNVYRTQDLTNWTNSLVGYYISEYNFTDIGYSGTAGSPVGYGGAKTAADTILSGGSLYTQDITTSRFRQEISAPSINSITGTTGGILTTSTTYYYRIAAIGNGSNEYGQFSKEFTYTTSNTQNAISLAWGRIPGASAYVLIRSTNRNAAAGSTSIYVNDLSFVDYGYSTRVQIYDPYAAYYPGSYGARFDADGRYQLPSLQLFNGTDPNLSVNLLPPVISSAVAGTGGTLANNTNFYYLVEAYDYTNQKTMASTEIVVNTGANNAVTLTWNEKNGAFYYKVYRSSTSNFENCQINQQVYGRTFTDINYPVINQSPGYGPGSASMYRFGTQHTIGSYFGLLSRSVIQTTPTNQAVYATDYALRLAGRPANTVYGSLFELGDFQVSGYNGSINGTYFGLSSATGFTGNFIDLQSSSVSRFKVDYLGSATIGSTTGSGSTSTGALVISGGVGIGQSLFTSPSYSSSISGAIFSNGSATLSGSFTQNNSSTTAFAVRNAGGTSILNVDTTNSVVSVLASTASTSTSTGALVVTGGVGIGGTLNIAGNASVGGTLNVSGTNSYFQNNLYVGNATQGRLYFSQATLGSAGTTVIPTMAFIGATNSPITLSVLPDNSLSFDGSSGQLFSINNNLSTGWIFSINDISGLPIFRTNADLTVAMGEYGGNVGIGLSNPTFKLQVSGNAGISGTTFISNTTASTNTTSGALVVSGGVGIGGSLNVSGASNISSVILNSGVITASLSGTATTASNVNVVSALTSANHPILFTPATGTASGAAVSSEPSFVYNPSTDILSVSGLAITSGTASTNTSTGALVVNGGLGVSGQLTFSRASFGFTGITSNPTMAFIGNTTASPINLTVLTDNSLSWEGSSGQLFSIDNNLTSGEIFAVSDISGLPIISASAGQTVSLNEFGGFTRIGNGTINSSSTTTGSLQVSGGVGISGTTSVGGRLQLFNGANYTALQSSASGNTVYTLPATSPGAGTSYLTSNSSGVMSWTAPIKANYVLSFGAGFTPTADSADSVSLNIPYSPDGTLKYYYVKRIEYRNETLSGGTGLSFYLQRHTSGNASWNTTNTITAGSGASFNVGASVYSASFTTIASSAGVAGSVISGDYVRLYFTGVGSAANVSIAMTIEEQ